jgi:hypothetical protein
MRIRSDDRGRIRSGPPRTAQAAIRHAVEEDTMPKNQTMPGNKHRSEKFHDPMPPREQEPADQPGKDVRGEGSNNQEGQFTGAGRTPGLQKK